jgi:formate dehydrogenase subunit gamma
VIRILALLLALLGAAPVLAQETATAPAFTPTDAAELELEAALNRDRISGRVSIPDKKAANLIQPVGRDWRQFHNTTLTWIGAVAVLGMIALLIGFFLYRGRIRIDGGWSGRTMTRFNLLERGNHWMVAGSFIILGLTGLNLTFGRHLLLPLIGPEAFTAVSQAGKIAHNYLAFPFTLGLVLMVILWAKDNIPNRDDIGWIKAFGGLLGHDHPDAGRFNAGQKSVFWMTVGGGAVVAISGYILIFPFTITDIAGQQWAHVVHGVLAVLMFAAMLAHAYIGSIGMEGAFAAMGTGQVDYNWAKEHHSLWVAQEMNKAQDLLGSRGAKVSGAD